MELIPHKTEANPPTPPGSSSCEIFSGRLPLVPHTSAILPVEVLPPSRAPSGDKRQNSVSNHTNFGLRTTYMISYIFQTQRNAAANRAPSGDKWQNLVSNFTHKFWVQNYLYDILYFPDPAECSCKPRPVWG